MSSPVSRQLLAIAMSSVSAVTLSAQQVERFTLEGHEVAIYNLAGRLSVVGGPGDRVTIEVTRGGRDASRLKLQTGTVRGRNALRVIYPEDRIYYKDMSWNGRSSFSISEDGTFGDRHNNGDRGNDRRRIEVSSRDNGLDAHADLKLIVPKGKLVALRQGIGETTIENVDSDLEVDVAASHTRIAHVHGSVVLDAGSGGVDVSDITGDVNIDAGSGGVTLDGVRGKMLQLDVGSGSFRGSAIDVTELKADVGSGGVRLLRVKASRLHLETGSGGSEVELLTSPDDVSVEAGSGGVTLRMPANTGAAIDIETGSGSIDSDFEVKMDHMERRHLRGTIGNGKGRIRIESGSGDVRLLRS